MNTDFFNIIHVFTDTMDQFTWSKSIDFLSINSFFFFSNNRRQMEKKIFQ